MSEFKAITTQEEFEMRLKERLEQKERNVLKKIRGIYFAGRFGNYQK